MSNYSFQFVVDCKTQHAELFREAPIKYEHLIKYRSNQHITSKNIYEATSKEQVSELEAHVNRVVDLDTKIKDGMNKKRWKPTPLIRRNVCSVMIWESAAYGSSDVPHTAESLVEKLSNELEKATSSPNKATKDLSHINELRRQIRTFSRFDPDEVFRLRSKPAMDVIAKLTFTDGRDSERVRLNQGGLFLVPSEGQDGTFEPIAYDKSNGKKGGESLYDIIEPYPYFFAKKGNLYRKKDIEQLREERELFSVNNIINRDLASKSN